MENRFIDKEIYLDVK